METKPAIYTTEFWFTILMTLSTLVNWTSIWDFMSNWHSGILQSVVTALYLVARGLAKNQVGVDPHNPATYTMFPTLKKVTNRTR